MSTQPAYLPAKSERGGRQFPIGEHVIDTEQAARQIFDPQRRWGKAWLRFFRLSGASAHRFMPNLLVACLLHDVGKANADFIAAVFKGEAQSVRHEHLSALVCRLPAVRRWLSENTDLDVHVITAAVLGHHLKAAPAGDWAWAQSRRSPAVCLFLGAPEVRQALERIAHVAALPPPPDLPAESWHESVGIWADTLRQAKRDARIFGRETRKPGQRRALLAAVKAGLIVADSVASALVRTDQSIVDWVSAVCGAAALTADSIDQSIIHPRARQIERRTGKPFQLQPFQIHAARQPARTLLLAGCGAGKTLAAWQWAKACCRDSDIGRVLFLYPTRGTATEGFRDYVGWAPETEATLMHGTAPYELDRMADNPSDATRGKDYSLNLSAQRLFSLGQWPRRYFSATVDTFFGFMENSYKSLCLLPALADSALIVDEVHSFDDHMFKNLLAFLEEFDVPVLCMTATLTPSRTSQLIAKGLTVYPTEHHGAIQADLKAKESHPRYLLEQLHGPDDALQRAAKAFTEGLRVLWVVNTVDRCQQHARLLTDELGATPLVYHSRFRLMDRQERHAEVVRAFQQMDQPVVAVTTQVCEMSLDLDADVLISELAPIPSLVQRLGRANRHLARGLDYMAPVYLYRPPRSLPYEHAEVDAACGLVAEFAGTKLSQRELAEAIARLTPPHGELDESARFLDGGYYATPGAFRDSDELSLECVLTDDLRSLQTIEGDKQAGYRLQVPRKYILDLDPSERPAWLPRHLNVASSSLYDAHLGFQTAVGSVRP